MASRRHPSAHSKKQLNSFLTQQKAEAGPYLMFAVASGFFNGSCLILQAWLLANCIDWVIFKKASWAHIKFYLAGLLAVFAVRAVLTLFSESFAAIAAARVKSSLRHKLYDVFRRLGPVRLGREDTGAVINTWIEGVDSMNDYYARYFPAMALTVMVPLAILVFVYPLDLLSAVLMTVTAPLIPIFMILIGLGTEKLNQQQWRKLSYLSGYFLNIIQGMMTLKLFNASKREADMVRRISDDYRAETMKVLRVAFLSSLSLEFFATVSIALVAVTIGFRLMWGHIDFHRGFFVLLLAPEFYLPLRRMGVHYHARLQAIGAADHMLDLFEKAPAAPGVAGYLRDVLSAPPQIVFENVTFAQGDRLILDSVNMTLAPGEIAGLVGETGAGKSTLMAMILGLVTPQNGCIRIDGADLRDIDLAAYRSRLGWVPQRPTVLYGTVRQNIILSNPSYKEEDFQHLCRDLKVDDFVRHLPEGYETVLGEKGYGLSGGQIQRIALARAFLRQGNVFLMDEPTAHLDPVTEQAIDQAMQFLIAGKTGLIIAHRPATLAALPVIYRLHNGQIAKVRG